jgi:glycosyltransferase involved in cell wall biosynthesis
MTVVFFHNAYLQAGGEDISAEAESSLARDHGLGGHLHLVSNEEIRSYSPLRKAYQGVLAAYDLTRARRECATALTVSGRTRPPRIAHVQNFFPLLTPAIHQAARECGLVSIQHLRNYRLACANGYFFREGRICEACLPGSTVPAIRHRCYQGSLFGSLAVARLIAKNRQADTWNRFVDGFVVMSGFGYRKAVEMGVDAQRLYYKPNFIHDPGPASLPSSSTTLVTIGRLSPEKGCDILVHAWSRCRAPGRLLVVGDGPERLRLEVLAYHECGMTRDRITFLGSQERGAVMDILKSCRCLLQPALWYEAFGRTVIEAYACGRPAIVSRIGALQELVNDGETGYAVNPGAVDAWSASMERMLEDDSFVDAAGRAGRAKYEGSYTPVANAAIMKALYATVLRRAGQRVPELLDDAPDLPSGPPVIPR